MVKRNSTGILYALLFIAFFVLVINEGVALAIDVKLVDTVNLTTKGNIELRPEIHVTEGSGEKDIYIAIRKFPTPYALRQFHFDSRKRGRDITLFPQEGSSRINITDFGSIFVNGFFYLAALSSERGDSRFRGSESFSDGGGDKPFQRFRMFFSRGLGSRKKGRISPGGGSDADSVRGPRGISLKIYKFDKDFNFIKSELVMKENADAKKSLIVGGSEANSLLVEEGDDPGMVSDGENIYVLTEIRKRGNFKRNDPQYKVNIFDMDLNKREVKEISAGRFNGGFHKLVYPIYHQEKFWILGEFVPKGYGDPVLPPFLRKDQPEKKNKDLFVMQYDKNWNPVGEGWQLTDTYPEIEYYATGFLQYKNYFAATYTVADSSEARLKGRLGDGNVYLSLFDKDFNHIKKIKISDKISSQGNISVFNNYLLVVYNEKEQKNVSANSRQDGKKSRMPTRADIMLKVFEITE
jgi:hypothetical protein